MCESVSASDFERSWQADGVRWLGGGLRMRASALFCLALLFAPGCDGCEGRWPPSRTGLPRLGGIPKSFFLGDNLEDTSDDPVFYVRFSIGNDPVLSFTPGSAAPLL